ncbi:MAG: hypothetical protein JWQ42_4913 [Edaphobacter sp.]|nr:hypothetical protein [Edaphobacter sp.]
MRALTHPATVAFGLANLYLLSVTGPLISSGHDLVYHLTGSASAIFVPVIVYVLTLWLLLTGLLAIAERPGRMRIVAWSAAVFVLPSILLRTFTGFFGVVVPAWVSLLVGLSCLLCWIVIALRWRRLQPVFEAALPGVATILGFFALSGAAIFVQLVWFGWQARDLNPPPKLHRAQVAAGSPRQRIVWILLDELSYQQVYERRFPGLQLPAFDQMAAQSTVFTHVVPTGEYTRFILPSLLTGVPSDGVRISGAGLLVAMHDTGSHRWNRFDAHKTVFQDALDAGYSTGIAGWYNAYCRILPAVLDHCYWIYHEATPANLSPERSVGANLLAPFHRAMLAALRWFGAGSGSPSDELLDIQMHSADYRELLGAGDAFLADPSINFLLLHMPVPHPFGFYDRRRGRMASRHTSYIDNLALADMYLAHLRQLLEQRHEWDSSAVVVMGDHSWRTSLIWASSEGWTEEDEAASHHGQFDDRPGYIVKLPHEQVGSRVDERFDAIRTRALFDALLQNRLRTPEELQEWVRQR